MTTTEQFREWVDNYTPSLRDPRTGLCDYTSRDLEAAFLAGIKSAGEFTPPTMEEWLQESERIGFDDQQARLSYFHFDANGWMVGRSKMRDWKSSVKYCKQRYEVGKNYQHK